ncbi:MAG: twitching motility protein PilT [Verrucomicrobia bacterium]|nr:twitching motility protein PilT [Verrucomicrobiota bacterium]
MIYLDTSYIVRLYFEDRGFAAVRELAASDHVACALHGQAEAIGAFHRKLREGAISPKAFRALLAQFDAERKAAAIHWFPANHETLDLIREVYARLPASVFLRAGDALHLATAALHGHRVIYSNDSHLLAATTHFGLKGINLTP